MGPTVKCLVLASDRHGIETSLSASRSTIIAKGTQNGVSKAVAWLQLRKLSHGLDVHGENGRQSLDALKDEG